MKKTVRLGAFALIPIMALGGLALAQSAQVTTLRGAGIDQQMPVDQIHSQIERRIERNYRQQPPLIPHSTEQYQIDLRTNQCLSCHDWTKAAKRNAPTLSMTHYLDRDGNELDRVAGTRYFCTQCHVPQLNAPALVDNTFESSDGQ